MTFSHQRGLVALSADPIHFGHLDLIRTASKRCKTLVVLVANNGMKFGSYLFPLEARTRMCARAIQEAEIENTIVIGSNGLLVDVYLEQGCDVLIRGIRDEKDRRYEEQQMGFHTEILPSLKGHIVFIPAREDLRDVSSTIVKGLAAQHVRVNHLVPLFVQEALAWQLHGQRLVGVTGQMASGKTWVCKQLVKQAETADANVSYINVDQLIRDLYEEQTPGAQKLREALATRFGDNVLFDDRRRVNRKMLAEQLFDSKTSNALRQEVQSLVKPHVNRLFRAALGQARGIVLVEWAQLIEMNMLDWVNGNVVIVQSPEQSELAGRRGVDAHRLEEVLKHQWSAERKMEQAKAFAHRHRHGQAFSYTNIRGDEHGPHELLSTLIGA